jgi:hypothetical protein
MLVDTVVLVPTTEHGVPSGNYDGSSQDFVADPVKAANYYRGRGGLQTVIFRVTSFTGGITIQATLDNDPLAARWIDVFEFGDSSTISDGSTTDVFPTNILGNFTWLRASVHNFTTGTIDLVTASY